MIIAIYLTPTQFECGCFSVWVISIKIKLHVHVSSIQILNKILIANKSHRNFLSCMVTCMLFSIFKFQAISELNRLKLKCSIEIQVNKRMHSWV